MTSILFDDIPSEFDEDIDETFHQWCQRNEHPYYSDDADYPEAFKDYYIKNVYPHTLNGEIAY